MTGFRWFAAVAALMLTCTAHADEAEPLEAGAEVELHDGQGVVALIFKTGDRLGRLRFDDADTEDGSGVEVREFYGRDELRKGDHLLVFVMDAGRYCVDAARLGDFSYGVIGSGGVCFTVVEGALAYGGTFGFQLNGEAIEDLELNPMSTLSPVDILHVRDIEEFSQRMAADHPSLWNGLEIYDTAETNMVVGG